MDQKIFWIVGIIIIIMGIGLAFTFISPDKESKHENTIAMAPYVVFEGTVVSLSLDPVNYPNGTKLNNVPNDTAVVKIDKIIETGGSNFNWTSIGMEKGKEISMGFIYTARPAKIIRVEGEDSENNGTITHSSVSPTVTFEKGFYVFTIEGDSDNETILPGLKIGSKFKAKVWKTFEFKIGEYKLLNNRHPS